MKLTKLSILFAVLLVAACSGEPEPENGGITVITQLPKAFPSSAADYELDIWTCEPWTAYVESDGAIRWITMAKESGEAGSGKIKFHLTANTGFDSRSAAIRIQAGDYSKKLTVKQNQNNSISVSTDEFTVSSIGERIEVQVVSNLDYRVVIPTDAPWITPAADDTKSLGQTLLKFDVAPNDTYMPRRSAITLETEEEEDITITVNQLRNVDLLVSQPDTVRLGVADTTFVIEISTNLEYTVDLLSESWLTIQETARGALTSKAYAFAAEENPKSLRRAEFVIEADSAAFSRTIVIEQSGPNDGRLALERKSLTAIFEATGGSEHWTKYNNWCSDEPVSRWYGITTDANGFVQVRGPVSGHPKNQRGFPQKKLPWHCAFCTENRPEEKTEEIKK